MKRLMMLSALLIAGCGAQAEDVTAETSAEVRSGQFCGGFAGFGCPTGYTCVDDPGDDCNPRTGGADCGGICVRDKACKPEKKYVSRDPNQCAAMLFLCEAGREPFFNSSGCGCACGTTDKCADPSRSYVTHDPYECQLIRYSCASGVGFSDECGCGCVN